LRAAAIDQAPAQFFPAPGIAPSVARQVMVVPAASEPSARQPEEAAAGVVGAAWAAAVQPQGAAVWVAGVRPLEGAAEAEVLDGEAGPQQEAAALAEEAPQRAARPSEELRAVGPLAAAWVFHRDRALPLPAPAPVARLAHAMASKRVASL
jgi:hypothetical protein